MTPSSTLPAPAEPRPDAPARSAIAAVPPACDVLVVGGGINGCGIARDLAGRGLRVVLCEQDDLASHTSSASTKLIHGGLRYLEHYEFALVRKALAEREGLLRSAPHIMWPLRFVMPHDARMRPAWMIRAGLFLYDHLARREVLPGSRRIDLRRHRAGVPLKPRFTKGFVYSDGWVDDARLVTLCAVDAAARGATILTRTRCKQATRGSGGWSATLQGEESGATHELTARVLVNAAGPWAAGFLRNEAQQPHAHVLRLVKGSHIVVRKLFEHRHAYIFQNDDRRIIFAIPYEGDYTLIGTTDVEYAGPLDAVAIDDGEIAYLCEQASRYFAKPVLPADVVWTYSGVRPLLEDESSDASAVTRDYRLELDESVAGAPLLSVWGGKITTFRKLGEEAADTLLAGPLAAGGSNGGGTAGRGAWTSGAFLPGGDLSGWIGTPTRPDTDFARFEQALAQRHPELPPATLHRWARCYGARIELLLPPGGSPGAEIAPGVFEAELAYLRDHEWARRVDDVLWRRTKLGLHLGAADIARVADWWAAHGGSDAPASTMRDSLPGDPAAACVADRTAASSPAPAVTPPSASVAGGDAAAPGR